MGAGVDARKGFWPAHPLAALMALLSCLSAVSPAHAGWAVETLDSVSIDSFHSVALDGKGNVHVAYYDRGDFKHATNASGKWEFSSVDRGPLGKPSIAVDANGKPHISYSVRGGVGELRYATRASGTWEVQTVDAWGQVGINNSLSLDSGGNAHISYVDFDGGCLKYATNGSGRWVVDDLITPSRDYPGMASNAIGVDRNGAVSIGFVSSGNGAVYYTTNGPGSWSVPRRVDAASTSDMRLDDRGRAHMSYYTRGGPANELRYATNASGAWAIERVPAGPGYESSVAIGGDGTRYVGASAAPGELWCAVKRPAGAWELAYVDRTNQHGDVSVAVDSLGQIHIVYVDNGANAIRHAADKKRIEENETFIAYAGRWTRVKCPQCADGAAMVGSGATGEERIRGRRSRPAAAPALPGKETATLRFTGTGVRWIAPKSNRSGKANVYVDDRLVTPRPVDLYSPAPTRSQVVYEARDLAGNAGHTLKVEVAPEKNPASKGFDVAIDAFAVLP